MEVTVGVLGFHLKRPHSFHFHPCAAEEGGWRDMPPSGDSEAPVMAVEPSGTFLFWNVPAQPMNGPL